jgi:Aerotolerance regulator N-terminal
MVWVHPAALFALVVVAAPILIHVLVQRRAEVVPFPTLRFLRPTALASLRRHLLEDPLLLAVRIAVVAAAVAAIAGPLAATRARRDAWNRRIVRASVTTVVPAVAGGGALDGETALQTKEFRDPSLADGIRRAVAWLDAAPPARRELVVAAPLTIGSLSAADIADVPPDVGLRFERVGTLTGERTVSYGSVRSADGIVEREVTLDGARTSVHDRLTTGPTAGGALGVPIEVVAAPSARPFVDAAIAAVLGERVWSPPQARRARLVLASPGSAAPEVTAGNGEMEPWIAEAIARLTRDDDLQRASAGLTGALHERRFSQAPWVTVARSRDNGVLIAAAAGVDHLVVVTSAPPPDVVLPILVRGIVNAIALVPDVVPLEIVPIPQAQLARWSRPATPRPLSGIDSVESDDRRWVWIAALGLLLVETWIRRSARGGASTAHTEERARVA